MAVKGYVVLVAVLVFAGVVAPVARAQLAVLVNVINPTNIFGVANITGIVPCSTGGTATSSPFPNATVVVTCGGSNITTGSTNINGVINFTLAVVNSVSAVVSRCSLVVTTPLASCNVTLPSTGILRAPLNLVSLVSNSTTIPNIIMTFAPGTFTSSVS